MSIKDELGRRCAAGCQTWPVKNIYKTCPICKEPTRPVRGVEPLGEDEAKSIRLLVEFEEFYENVWVPNEDPLPAEMLARIEAWPERFEPRSAKKVASSDITKTGHRTRISGIKSGGKGSLPGSTGAIA